MIIKDLGLVPYEKTDALLESYIPKTKIDNFLLLCTHPPVYTVGSEEYRCDLEVVQTDRGGSITYFDEGTLMLYFAFAVPNPAKFYAKVLKAVQNFFSHFDAPITYDKARPGFYIENRKIASLGFRYKKGASKHGVALHINPNLVDFNKIAPCGLKGVQATSLWAEGYPIAMDEAKILATKAVIDAFEA